MLEMQEIIGKSGDHITRIRWWEPQVLWRFLRFVFAGFQHNKGLEVAKSLTYTSLFAVVPLVTLVLSILSAFPSFQVFGSQIQDMIFDRLLPASSTELEGYFSTFAAQAKNLTWMGAVMLLVTSYLMLVNVERSFNHIWGVGELRKGLSSFLLYWSVLSLGPLLLGIGFAISSYITSLTLFERFSEFSDLFGARRVMLGIFPVLLTAGAFTLLYVAVPNCGVKFRHGLAGAAVVSVAFIAVKKVFTLSIATASYQLIYGTFAAIPIFLLWLYVGWLVILFGANLVRSIPLFTTDTVSDEVHPSLLLLALIHKFWEKQRTGEELKVQELMDQQWPFRSMDVESLLNLLQQQRLIRPINHDEYLLVRDLDTISLWELLGSCPWAQPGSKDLALPVPAVLKPHLPGYDALAKAFLQLESKAGKEFAGSFQDWFRTHESGSPAPAEPQKLSVAVVKQ
jgi:membrane protein